MRKRLPLEWELEPDPVSWQVAHGLLKRNSLQAVIDLQKLAERGSTLAMLDLGRCYALGIGTPVDAVKAEECFKSVADKGSVWAHRSLGRFYMRLHRYHEAENAFKYAASKGVYPAYNDLAAMYQLGRGVDKDVGIARKYYERGVAGGNIISKACLAKLVARNGTWALKISSFATICAALLEAFFVARKYGIHSRRLLG